jgi:hypothetical protein
LLVTNSAAENGHLALADAGVLRPFGKVLLLLLSVACKQKTKEGLFNEMKQQQQQQ